MEGSNQEQYLSKVHFELLKIMDEIDRVCEKHDIQYYLIAGTLLGAVRHKGFIPWDDDLDIGMTRDNFDKFLSVCETELRSPFELKWITTDAHYYRLFPKVVNTNTVFAEERAENLDSNFGFFVDIFPLDYTNGYGRLLEIRKFFIRKIGGMISEKDVPGSLHGFQKFITGLFSRKTLYGISTSLMTRHANSKTPKFLTNFVSQYPVKKQTMAYDIYGTGEVIEFEDRRYKAPAQYCKFLENLYGPNYMKIPPIEKRRTHYPKYVKFEDGSEIKFDKYENKVSIYDTF